MTNGTYRIGIVGASTLAGKELTDQLNESQLAAADFVLLDDDSAGQIASAGDEAAIVQQIDESSFDRMDFVFFAGNSGTTKKYWEKAHRAGASIIDTTYTLGKKVDVLVRAPWIEDKSLGEEKSNVEPDLKTSAIVSAHPAAMMLALTAKRLKKNLGLKSLAAIVFEPASEHGKEAMDELHQQTVNLLSFQSLPQDQFDTQIAFNLVPYLGKSSRIDLKAAQRNIGEHFKQIMGDAVDSTIQVIQAPVFHGFVISALVELNRPSTLQEIKKELSGSRIAIAGQDDEVPSNVSAATQDDILVKVLADEDFDDGVSRIWIWLAADNLKLMALNAIACANELRYLRPKGKIQ